MKKIATILLFIISITNSNAKDLFDKLSKQTCSCLDKKDPENFEQGYKECVEEVILNNVKELKEYYHIQSIAELDVKDCAIKLSLKLMKDCESAYKYYSKITAELDPPKKYEIDQTLVCDQLHNGKYYYLTLNPSKSYDTTHVIIDGDSYVEIIGTEKTYSRLSIKWINSCTFQVTFIESNDTVKNAFSKKGDKYEYAVVQNHPDKMVVRMLFNGDEYFNEFFKE